MNEQYLWTIESKCRRILEELGIMPGKVCNVRMQDNPKVCESSCVVMGDKGFEIRIDDLYHRDELTEYDLMCTMLHELLHTIPGCFDHKGKWAKYARCVTEKTEYDLLRLKVGKYEMLHPDAKVLHKAVCPECGSYMLLRNKRRKWNDKLPGGGKICRCGSHMVTVF